MYEREDSLSLEADSARSESILDKLDKIFEAHESVANYGVNLQKELDVMRQANSVIGRELKELRCQLSGGHKEAPVKQPALPKL